MDLLDDSLALGSLLVGSLVVGSLVVRSLALQSPLAGSLVVGSLMVESLAFGSLVAHKNLLVAQLVRMMVRMMARTGYRLAFHKLVPGSHMIVEVDRMWVLVGHTLTNMMAVIQPVHRFEVMMKMRLRKVPASGENF